MPRIEYLEKNFQPSTLRLIEQANDIVAEFDGKGFDLTLRQLYYQMVSRDIIENTQRSYKRLGSILNDARLAGLMDWDAIEDRTRNLQTLTHWESVPQIVSAMSRNFRYDKWATQGFRPEVWVEKDALAGVVARACDALDVPYFACRGYTSQSEMWRAAMRLEGYLDNDQIPIIFHLGDHDPSGVDMTRDIIDRLEMFMGGVEVERLALNWNQIEQYTPPPNPAKITDSRSSAYITQFGRSSWELDALEPQVIVDMITSAILQYRDETAWDIVEDAEADDVALLRKLSRQWATVAESLK